MKRTLTEKDESNNENLPVKLIKIQPRKKWNPEEEASIVSEFTNHIRTKCTPSANEIRKAQEKYPCLKNRSIAVIKTKVNNIILGKCNVGLMK